MSSSAAALAGFRHLVRAQRKAFAGDSQMQAGAVNEIRGHFEKNRDASDPEEIRKLIAGCYGAADFLSTFVVQAELNERGNYGECLLESLTQCCKHLEDQFGLFHFAWCDKAGHLCFFLEVPLLFSFKACL